jgi:DnaK suppressor protein
MTQINIEQFRRKLELEKKNSLRSLNRFAHERRSVEADFTVDDVDRCTADLEKESLFERSSQSRIFLRLIEAALARIEDGSFGVCAGCGEDIQPRRLEAVPWAQFCLRCQEELEQRVDSSLSARLLVGTGESWRRVG